MVDETHDNPVNPETNHLLLLVVGSHLDAERHDRPMAYRLKDRIDTWFQRHAANLDSIHEAVVCSDIWYINQPDLHKQPTLSLGSPAVNALSAYLRQKLPEQYAQKDQMLIQLDPDFVSLRCSIWGMDHNLTRQAVDYFIREYLHDYLRAAVTQVEPHME